MKLMCWAGGLTSSLSLYVQEVKRAGNRERSGNWPSTQEDRSQMMYRKFIAILLSGLGFAVSSGLDNSATAIPEVELRIARSSADPDPDNAEAARWVSRHTVSPDARTRAQVFLSTFPGVMIQNSGCSAVLWSHPGSSTWGGCAQSTACNGECVPEEEVTPLITYKWCDCPDWDGIGCYSQIELNPAGIVTDVRCDAFECEECDETTPPAPLPEGPPIKYRACYCLEF